MQTLSIGVKKRIYDIAFSPNGEHLVASCGDLRIRVWDLATERVIHTGVFEKPNYVISGFNVAYLDDHHLLFGGAALGIWDIEKDQWKIISPEFVWDRQMNLSPDRNYYVEVSQGANAGVFSGIRLYHANDWKQINVEDEQHETTGGLAFSPDGSQLATGHVRLVGYKHRHVGHFGRFEINDYAYVVHIREMPSGRVLRSIGDWKQSITNLAFSPNGAILAGTAGIWLRIWDLVADCQVALHKRGPKHFQGVSFNADGKFLATVSNDKTVRIWDANTWQEYRTYNWEIGSLLNIAFAPDGLRAAAGSDKGQIVIWDVD
jgi:WD40 repeat protein